MKSGRFLTDRQIAVLLLIPVLIILGSVGVIPLVSALRLSFTDTNITSFFNPKFVGLKNFADIFSDVAYRQTIANTFFIAGVAVVGRLAFGLGLALILAGTVIKRRKNLFRSLFIIPWLIPGVAMVVIWMWILGTRTGIINYMLKSLHLIEENIPWLADKDWAKVSVVMTFIWNGTPFIMIVLIAGLQTIPQDLIDASRIDGAGYWNRFMFVIFPFLRPVMTICVFLSLIYIFQNFVVIQGLTGGGPGIATQTFSLYVYQTAFNVGRIGKACAIGTTWLAFLTVFALFYLRSMVGTLRKS